MRDFISACVSACVFACSRSWLCIMCMLHDDSSQKHAIITCFSFRCTIVFANLMTYSSIWCTFNACVCQSTFATYAKCVLIECLTVLCIIVFGWKYQSIVRTAWMPIYNALLLVVVRVVECDSVNHVQDCCCWRFSFKIQIKDSDQRFRLKIQIEDSD